MQTQRPVLIQEQRLKMSPQLIQSIKMMTLPLLDLRQRIQEEIERNPALEILEERVPESLDDIQTESPTEYEYFENSSDSGYTNTQAEDKKRQFIEGTVTRQETLQDHLIWQLRVIPLSKKEFDIGLSLIQNLNEDGFHRENPFLLHQKEEILTKKLIKLIQTFEPQGTCTNDYKDSLITQIHIKEETLEKRPPKEAETIITNYLDLLEKGKTQQIAKILKINEVDVLDNINFIKTLNPFPGRAYSGKTSQFVVPDLMVKMKDGEFILIANDEEIPVLGINSLFDEILTNDHSTKNDKEFVSKRIKDAQWFLRSLNQRNDTLVRVAKAIIEFQRDFFRKGPRFLVPLILKDIAEVVELHETTISRITTNKYIQTVWGIFELKYFFSNAVTGTNITGSSYSKESVKFIIKEIIEESDGIKRLSDQKISDILEKKGIQIARRTVSKYRKELDIDSSFGR